jgi:hypothetical protein
MPSSLEITLISGAKEIMIMAEETLEINSIPKTTQRNEE